MLFHLHFSFLPRISCCMHDDMQRDRRRWGGKLNMNWIWIEYEGKERDEYMNPFFCVIQPKQDIKGDLTTDKMYLDEFY